WAPVHVTIKMLPGVPSVRREPARSAVFDALREASKDGFRVVQFSLQRDHLHLLVEADDRDVLQRGMQGLSVRVAKAINRAAQRRGKVLADRYHARGLAT